MPKKEFGRRIAYGMIYSLSKSEGDFGRCLSHVYAPYQPGGFAAFFLTTSYIGFDLGLYVGVIQCSIS